MAEDNKPNEDGYLQNDEQYETAEYAEYAEYETVLAPEPDTASAYNADPELEASAIALNTETVTLVVSDPEAAVFDELAVSDKDPDLEEDIAASFEARQIEPTALDADENETTKQNDVDVAVVDDDVAAHASDGSSSETSSISEERAMRIRAQQELEAQGCWRRLRENPLCLSFLVFCVFVGIMLALI